MISRAMAPSPTPARWALDLGLRPGERVPLIWLGLLRVGIVTALLNTQLVDAGLAHALGVAAASLRRIRASMR